MRKHTHFILIAVLVLALAAPAMASPFADVPAYHWAYDAVTQLAAYGLIQGFPDGTFKGDQPMTRYQMAMVVARLLVQLDSQIKSEIEAAKTSMKAEQPAAKGAEQPVLEKIVEQKVIDAAQAEALAKRIDAVEGQGKDLGTQVSTLSSKVDEVAAQAGAAAAKADAAAEQAGAATQAASDAAARADAATAKADEAAAKADDAGAKAEEAIAKADEASTAASQAVAAAAAADEKAAEAAAKVDELAAKVDAGQAATNEKIDSLGVKIDEVSSKVDVVDAKADTIDAKVAVVDDKVAEVDAKADAIKKAAEDKALELISMIDALKDEFAKELDILGVRTGALDDELARVNARLAGLETRVAEIDAKVAEVDAKVGAVDTKVGKVAGDVAAVGTKLDTHIAGHEKVTISGSSELKYEDVTVTGKGTPWEDPNDIFADEAADILDGDKFEPKVDFYHQLELKLKANVAQDISVDATVSAKNRFADMWDPEFFELTGLTLDVKTPGVVRHIYAGGVKLPDGTFTPYTLTGDKLLDNGDAKYSGALAELAYGNLTSTLLALRLQAADPGAIASSLPGGNGLPEGHPDYVAETTAGKYDRYAIAADAKIALNPNLKVGATYVKAFDDDRGIYTDYFKVDPYDAGKPVPLVGDPSTPRSDAVGSVNAQLTLAPGWTVSTEIAKRAQVKDNVETAGSAFVLDATGKAGPVELTAGIKRVEDTFAPLTGFELINTDTDNGGIETGVKSYSLGAKLPIDAFGGKLTLTGGYKLSGNASAAGDWDTAKSSNKTGSVEYATKFAGLDVTGKAGIDSTYYELDTTYIGKTDVLKLNTGVEVGLAPFKLTYDVTNARIDPAGTGSKDFYREAVVGLEASHKMGENVTLTAGYDYDKREKKITVGGYLASGADDPAAPKEETTFKAGADVAFNLSETIKVGGGYNYEVTNDLLNDYRKVYKSILKGNFESRLSEKATLSGDVGIYKLDRQDSVGKTSDIDIKLKGYVPMTNLIGNLNYSYALAPSTTLNLGYGIVKSDCNTDDPNDTANDYTATKLSAGLKLTF